MKKIIDGKTYDTEKSENLAEMSSNGGPGDFRYYEETLYRTQRGRYFVYGIGGPMTKYAQSTGQNSWSGGSRIDPISESEARKWCEENLDGDEYEKIFTPREEGDDLVNRERVTLSLSKATVAILKDTSIATGKPMTRLVDDAVKASYDTRS